MICKTCGKQSEAGDKFCQYCGARLEAEPIVPESATPAPIVPAVPPQPMPSAPAWAPQAAQPKVHIPGSSRLPIVAAIFAVLALAVSLLGMTNILDRLLGFRPAGGLNAGNIVRTVASAALVVFIPLTSRKKPALFLLPLAVMPLGLIWHGFIMAMQLHCSVWDMLKFVGLPFLYYSLGFILFALLATGKMQSKALLSLFAPLGAVGMGCFYWFFPAFYASPAGLVLYRLGLYSVTFFVFPVFYSLAVTMLGLSLSRPAKAPMPAYGNTPVPAPVQAEYPAHTFEGAAQPQPLQSEPVQPASVQPEPEPVQPKPAQDNHPAAATNTAAQGKDIMALIKDLAQLRDQGILSQDEFDEKKKDLLSRL